MGFQIAWNWEPDARTGKVDERCDADWRVKHQQLGAPLGRHDSVSLV